MYILLYYCFKAKQQFHFIYPFYHCRWVKHPFLMIYPINYQPNIKHQNFDGPNGMWNFPTKPWFPVQDGAPPVISWFIIPLTSSIYLPQLLVKLELCSPT